MVGKALEQPNRRFRGPRPFNAARDLSGVALLLEQAFREDLGFLHAWTRVPLLREVGAFFWAASLMPGSPEALTGFVWEEEGRIVGNVSLSPDDSRRSHWLVSNVAVEERFRRRGIARQLMEGGMQEAERRGARRLVLNVRPNNRGAIKLYEQLGFAIIDTEMAYVSRRSTSSNMVPLPLRRLATFERRAAYNLAREDLGERLIPYRPARIGEYGVNTEDRLAEQIVDFFIRQSTERWGYFEDGRLQATVTLRAQRLGSPHSLEIRSLPSVRARVADGLLASALQRLAAYPRREISIRVFTSWQELVVALGNAGFVPTRGLTLMVKELKP